MPETLTIRQAKRCLFQLIRRVEAGEEVVIVRHGKPVARLVATGPTATRSLGRDRGLFAVPDDFNEPVAPSRLGCLGG